MGCPILFVTPAQAGVHVAVARHEKAWMPAFAGMTAFDSSLGPTDSPSRNKSQRGGEDFIGRGRGGPSGTLCRPAHLSRRRNEGGESMRSILLWVIGIPIPIILLIAFCTHHF
jgi:hypothetical protein